MKMDEIIGNIEKLTRAEQVHILEYLTKTLKINLEHEKDTSIEAAKTKFPCPHCGNMATIKFGHRCGKQRFKCKECGKTFVETTNTLMKFSHFGRDAWKTVIEDTIDGKVSLDKTAEKIHCSHATAFNMRHKILMTLGAIKVQNPHILSDIAELDETYVLESYKGRKFDGSEGRKPRKHGAKALLRGISNEQICIMAGVQRNGIAFASTVNRAHPDKSEIRQALASHLANGTVAFTDGLKGYKTLESVVDCAIESVSAEEQKQSHTANLNTVNGFHSAIQERYRSYRGVATKYLNRYNCLFYCTFGRTLLPQQLIDSILNHNCSEKVFNVKDVTSFSLLIV